MSVNAVSSPGQRVGCVGRRARCCAQGNRGVCLLQGIGLARAIILIDNTCYFPVEERYHLELISHRINAHVWVVTIMYDKFKN